MAMLCISGCRECTGCMNCYKEPDPIHCDICGKEVEYLYKDKDGNVVGCDNCIKQVDPYEE